MLAAASQEPGFSVSASAFAVCPAAGLHAEPITLHQTLVFPACCHPRKQTQQEGEGHHAGELLPRCCRGTPGDSPIPVTNFPVLLFPRQAGPYALHPDCPAAATCTTYRNAAFIFNLKGVTQGRVSYRGLESIQAGSDF